MHTLHECPPGYPGTIILTYPSTICRKLLGGQLINDDQRRSACPVKFRRTSVAYLTGVTE